MPEEKVSQQFKKGNGWSYSVMPAQHIVVLCRGEADCPMFGEPTDPELHYHEAIPVPPAADAGPRQPCAGGGGYGSCRDARDPELCANCEPPVPQETRELTKAEWKEIAEGPCEAEDDDLSLDAKATAPDWAMRLANAIYRGEFEHGDRSYNAVMAGMAALIRQAESERERELEGMLRAAKAMLQISERDHPEAIAEFVAEASRLLGGE